jgi:hypothetical protein
MQRYVTLFSDEQNIVCLLETTKFSIQVKKCKQNYSSIVQLKASTVSKRWGYVAIAIQPHMELIKKKRRCRQSKAEIEQKAHSQ